MDSHTGHSDHIAPPRRWQFSLQSLLWLCVGASLFCVPPFYFGPEGWLASAVLLTLGLFVWGMKASDGLWAEVLAAVVLIGAAVAITLPAIDGGCGGPSYRSSCINNLNQIAKALLMYEADHGTFPPAYIVDENGRPMHSWRVLILPYIEERKLYDAYNFDEPWDGPNNSRLHGKMPRVFQCPGNSTNPPNQQASYMAVVGEQTMWPGEVARTLGDVKDGLDQTIFLVEVHNSGVHWMEPRDLDYATLPPSINSGPAGRSISSGHDNGAVVAFADCHTQYLPQDMVPKLLDALLTVNGGEEIPAELP